MSEPSTSSPAPSKHVFLTDVVKLPFGTKVRFLCCVIDYEVSTSRLRVAHAYPRDRPSAIAELDVSHVLESIKSTDIASGTWLNVIGYVQAPRGTSRKSKPSDAPALQRAIMPLVQVILMWSAGTIRIQEYEKTLEHHNRIQATAAKT